MINDQRIITLDDAPTLADLFNERCIRSPDGLAYIQYRDGDWQHHSWEETRIEVARWQAAITSSARRPCDLMNRSCRSVSSENRSSHQDFGASVSVSVRRIRSPSLTIPRRPPSLSTTGTALSS